MNTLVNGDSSVLVKSGEAACRCSVTAVIATLGEETLERTIDILNGGTVVPDEILVCIPAKEAPNVQRLAQQNVKVVVTECRGQVGQRLVGFRQASCDVVVQLDSDCVVDRCCVERLLLTLRTRGPKVAVGPALMMLSGEESVYKKPQVHEQLLKLYYWIVNGQAGYEPGVITKAGTEIGVDPEGINDEVVEVDWLPGGCVMHWRENLLLENFYPFDGKAWCEDLIHSCRLRQGGVGLLVDLRAQCRLQDELVDGRSAREYLRELAGEWRARSYFLRLMSRGRFRMRLHFLGRCIVDLYRRLAEPDVKEINSSL